MSKRWQYKVVEIKPQLFSVKPEHVEERLTQLGMQGWELVSVIQIGMNTRLYLKKEP